jgi:uracil-DNA glycosylase
MKTEQFVSNLRGLKFENVFNPYTDLCAVHDLDDAPERRAKALLGMLNAAASTEIDALWIGRDLGYRGGRRTGLALTDDVHLSIHATRWNISIERATTGSIVAERTAAVIWSMLASVTAQVFLWNVFPFHPHEPDDPFTNRSHSSRERVAGEAILAELILILRPRRLVCIGNDATKTALRMAGLTDVVKVRHPSYGGQRDFVSQIGFLYDVRAEVKQLSFADEL